MTFSFFLSFFQFQRFVQGVSIQGVYVLGGICPVGKCPGGRCPGGFVLEPDVIVYRIVAFIVGVYYIIGYDND